MHAFATFAAINSSSSHALKLPASCNIDVRGAAACRRADFVPPHHPCCLDSAARLGLSAGSSTSQCHHCSFQPGVQHINRQVELKSLIGPRWSDADATVNDDAITEWDRRPCGNAGIGVMMFAVAYCLGFERTATGAAALNTALLVGR